MAGKRKKIIIGGLLIVVGIPLACLATLVTWFAMERKTNGTIVSSGEPRNYLLYVPKTYDRSQPTPLLISLQPGRCGHRRKWRRAGGTSWPMSAVSSSSIRRRDLGFRESGPCGQAVWNRTSSTFPI